MRLAMLIDLHDCIGCQACVTACKERWDSGPGAARCWVTTVEAGRRGHDLALAFYPGLCMQCESHPCTTGCPTGATYMNERGVVVVDPDVCIGCASCVPLCPYGARRPDPVKGIVEKCNLCLPYVERGEAPACVTTCLAACRHFGALDDPSGELVRLGRERGALPLKTAEIDVGPKVVFAGERERGLILASGALRTPRASWLTRVWTEVSRPLARYVVPAGALGAVAGGLVVNLIARRRAVAAASAGAADVPPTAAAAADTELLRHRTGMRFLHWFNALSWVLLLVTGTALMSARDFALFGTGFPQWVATRLGGPPALLRLHVVWGLAWAAITIPLFLLFKRGGREALEEVRLRPDDLRWLLQKPLAMIGRAQQPLPAQDKYNAGQKVFALTAVAGTATIILSGMIMTFHWGGADVVATAILAHKLAIALALLGLSVHLTMAAVVREERPALRSMLTGRVDVAHARAHSARWVDEIAASGGLDASAGAAAPQTPGRDGQSGGEA